jgi:uncharacterized protein (TIGR02996 family)
VDEEAGFLAALATAPTNLLTHLIYADWLDEHDDPGGSCLRAWVELVQLPHSDATYRHLLAALEQYQVALGCADPLWVALVGEARIWVDAALAEKVARLHLRVRHGRKSDRQWLGRPNRRFWSPLWSVPFWRNNPNAAKGTQWADRVCWRAERDQCVVRVDPVTATVHEPPNPKTETARREQQPA